LSPQQERLLWLNLWGYPDQAIAHALGIQLHTVQDYQLALRRKTGVKSKAGYLRLLLEYLGTQPPLEGDGRRGKSIHKNSSSNRKRSE
jgi:DNA-binding CsgD family transcriptional regulator